MGFDDNMARGELSELVSRGSVATLHQTVKLVEDQALRAQQNEVALDLAVFDCYACHHDLKLPASDQSSWRQERGFHGVPGRPPMRAWPWALASAAMANSRRVSDHADLITGAHTDFSRLQDAFAARPFGEPTKVSEAAATLASRLDMVRQMMAHSWNDQRASALAADICSAGMARRFADFDEARSIGWALTTLQQDRPLLFSDSGPTPRPMNMELGLNIAAQAEALDPLNGYDPVLFERQLESLLKTIATTSR
jgi:hypothetical protein